MPGPTDHDSPADPGASEPPASPRSRVVGWFVATSAVLSLLLFAGTAFGLGTYFVTGDDGEFENPEHSETPGVFGPCVEKVCTYLLLGSDSRAGLTPEEQEQFGTNDDIGGASRADTIMLVQTDPRREKAVVLSFPRDLWVRIPGYGFDKINASFQGGIDGGGPLLVARTVHQLTGLRINHVLYVDLAGFQGVVDTLGGVDLCLPFDMQDELTGLDLRAGCQRLDGLQALAYVRTREQPCDSAAPDFYRITRQQQFLRAVINRLLQPGELLQLPTMVGPILSNIRRDEGLNPADLAYLVGQLQGVSTGNVDFRAVPGHDAYFGSKRAIEMEPESEALFRALRRGGTLPEVGKQLPNTPKSEANIPVLVVDHSAGSAAADVGLVLSESGFDIEPGTTTFEELGVRVAGNTIAYSAGNLEEAQVVAKYFPGLQVVEANIGNQAPVAVFVTSSYEPQEPAPGTPPTCVDPTA